MNTLVALPSDNERLDTVELTDALNTPFNRRLGRH